MRLSGPDAFALLNRVAAPPPGGWQPRVACLRLLRDPAGQALDKALVLPFPAPASFTGEDLIEFHVHGNPVLVARLLEILVAAGAALADRGGFARRAILNGKLGLPEAEALAELIDAVSPPGVIQALARLNGGLRRWAEQQRRALVSSLAQLEAHVDFPDEPIEPDASDAIAAELDRVAAELSTQADRAATARVWTEGARIVLAGAPNAGKSTLLNRLVGAERAIVSPEAGTTRDYLEVGATLDGVPVRYIDTAGLRQTDHPIEREGVARSLAQADDADLVIVVHAPDATFVEPDGWRVDGRKRLDVWNKRDIAAGPDDLLSLSAADGAGVEALLAAIAGRLAPPEEPPPVSSLRQEEACRAAAACLTAGALHLREGLPPEIAAADVHDAAGQLDRLLGIIDPEDVLDELFARFCIGK